MFLLGPSVVVRVIVVIAVVPVLDLVVDLVLGLAFVRVLGLVRVFGLPIKSQEHTESGFLLRRQCSSTNVSPKRVKLAKCKSLIIECRLM